MGRVRRRPSSRLIPPRSKSLPKLRDLGNNRSNNKRNDAATMTASWLFGPPSPSSPLSPKSLSSASSSPPLVPPSPSRPRHRERQQKPCKTAKPQPAKTAKSRPAQTAKLRETKCGIEAPVRKDTSRRHKREHPATGKDHARRNQNDVGRGMQPDSRKDNSQDTSRLQTDPRWSVATEDDGEADAHVGAHEEIKYTKTAADLLTTLSGTSIALDEDDSPRHSGGVEKDIASIDKDMASMPTSRTRPKSRTTAQTDSATNPINGSNGANLPTKPVVQVKTSSRVEAHSASSDGASSDDDGDSTDETTISLASSYTTHSEMPVSCAVVPHPPHEDEGARYTISSYVDGVVSCSECQSIQNVQCQMCS